MGSDSLTERLVRFARDTRYEDIPAQVIAVQKRSLLDLLGVMAAATTLEPACIPFLEYAAEHSARGECTVFGTGLRASRSMAAMANGALIHALDYEDGHDRSKSHPNTASTPVALALGESLDTSGRELLAALVVSSEICCRLKLSLRVDDLRCGWYSPPMFSAYGAVFGAARLLGLSAEQTLDALSICTTQVLLLGQAARSGHSALRAVREAFSAKAAMYSALMADKGLVARMEEPLEGELGFFAAFFGGRYDPETILDGLGSRYECGALRFKPWPCCGTTHAAVDALLTLMGEHDVAGEDIRAIELVVSPVHLRVLEPREVKYRPRSLAAAKFSLPFSLALAARYGAVTLDLYREEMLENEELLAIADRVRYTVHDAYSDLPEQGFEDDHVALRLRTALGEVGMECVCSRGSPDKPLSERQLREKFFDCMHHSRSPIGEEQCRAIHDMVQRLETLPSLRAFFELFASI